MALADVIEDVEGQRKTLTVFNPDANDTILADLAEYFETQNVTITGEQTPSGKPSGFATLTRDGEFLAATSLDTLRELLETTPTGDDGLGIDDSAYHELLQYVKETTFTSYSKAQMIQASKEIEDRAYRHASGELHAGFQFGSIMEGQQETYEQLADVDLEIHTYATPDGTDPRFDGVEVHLEDIEELRESWFVVYDGDGNDQFKSALLAEEREPNAYFGFWTYDPGIVDRIVEYLHASYTRVSQ